MGTSPIIILNEAGRMSSLHRRFCGMQKIDNANQIDSTSNVLLRVDRSDISSLQIYLPSASEYA